MHTFLSPHGVWYIADLLPVESPAHWAYTYFAGAWKWVRQRTLDLHVLYQRLQAASFKAQVKRRVWYRPVQLGAALEIAQQRPGLLARLSMRRISMASRSLNKQWRSMAWGTLSALRLH